MGICGAFRAVAAREKYPDFILLPCRNWPRYDETQQFKVPGG